MNKKVRNKIIVLIMTLLIVGITGCSNSSKDNSDNSTLGKIKQQKVLTVGTDATFKPFEYKANGKYEGFDVDLMKAVAKEIGATKVNFVDTEFKGLIPGLQAKKFDLIVSAMYITDERKKVIDFSDTYFPGGLSIVVKKNNNNIKGLDDLRNKKVAVQIGTKSADFLTQSNKNIQVVKVDSNEEMFLELETGKVDAVVTGLPAAKVYAKQKGTVKVLDKTLTHENYGYGIRKSDKALTKAVNEAIRKLKKNGEYNKIVKKWFE